MERILKFLRLPDKEKALLIRSAFCLLATRLALSLFSFKKVQKILDNWSHPAKASERDEVWKLIWAIETMSRILLPRKPCLTKAMTARMMLSRRGYETVFKIGVLRTENGKLEAHAWLENSEGIIVGNIQNLCQYTPLMGLESV